MITRIIEISVRNRVFVLLIAVLAVVAGWWFFRNTPIDAIPDLSDVQVIVYSEYPGQAPRSSRIRSPTRSARRCSRCRTPATCAATPSSATRWST